VGGGSVARVRLMRWCRVTGAPSAAGSFSSTYYTRTLCAVGECTRPGVLRDEIVVWTCHAAMPAASGGG
jgi:hypothetical protein